MQTLSGNSSAERPGDVLALTAEADTCTVDCELRVIIRWHPKCWAVQGPAAQEHPFCSSLLWITSLTKKSALSKLLNHKCWTGEELDQTRRKKNSKKQQKKSNKKGSYFTFSQGFVLTRANYFPLWSFSMWVISMLLCLPCPGVLGRHWCLHFPVVGSASQLHPAAPWCAGRAERPGCDFGRITRGKDFARVNPCKCPLCGPLVIFYVGATAVLSSGDIYRRADVGYVWALGVPQHLCQVAL